MSVTELKPCPFCGGEAPEITNWRDGALPCVQCSASCGAVLIHNSSARAVDAWNRRAPDPLADELAKALEKCVNQLKFLTDGPGQVHDERMAILDGLSALARYREAKS